MSDILELTTGLCFSKEELQAVASHITDNTRKFNLNQGLTPEDDRLPRRFLTVKLENGQGITGSEVEHLVHDYYRLRGWTRDGISQ